MLSFTENKKKREEKADDKEAAKVQQRQPAWQDKSMQKLQVSIEEKSRLRKLKKSEAETHIEGK